MNRVQRWALLVVFCITSGCGSGDKAESPSTEAGTPSTDAGTSAASGEKRSHGVHGAAGGTAEQRLGINAETAGRDSIDSVITGAGFGLIGSIITPFKALPATDRGDVIRSLALCLQAYYQSDAFKTDYAKIRLERKPQPVTYEVTPEQEVDQSIADSKKQMAEARKTLLPMLPEANRAEVEQSYRDNEKSLDDPVMRQYRLTAVQTERAARQTEYEESVAKWQETYPEDPQPIILKRLEGFVALADSIDFNAQLTTGKDGLKHFVNPEYEAKSGDWKWAFRTGRDGVAAAREVAANWLAEVK
jgi:hypothetical protein